MREDSAQPRKRRDLIVVFSDRRLCGGNLLIAYSFVVVVLNLWPFDFHWNHLRWREVSSGIQFEKAGQAASAYPSKWLYERLVGGSGLSLEVCLKAQNDRQTGPARIVSYSSNTSVRNFTLGQDEKKLVMRLRTVQTDLNGTEPHLEVDKVVDPSKQQQIVVTYDFVEQCVYIDGILELCSEVPGGNFENWDSSHFFVLGNEATGDRPWVGEIFLVAVYNRALGESEVRGKYETGLGSKAQLGTESAAHSKGLVAQYLFDEKGGRKINDTSGAKPRLDLYIPRMITNYDKSYLEKPDFSLPIDYIEIFEALLHVIVFIPAGFLLYQRIWQRLGVGCRAMGLSFIALTLFAFGIESLQHLSLSRHSSCLDLACHMLGIAVGIVAHKRFVLSFRKASIVS